MESKRTQTTTQHISSYWNSSSDWFGEDLECWYGVEADFGNQSSSNIFSVTAEMNIGHAADTAQEDWSCNIFDVIVVTAGYGKNSTREGLDKWWWDCTYLIGDCNVDQKIDIFDSPWITGQYGKWCKKNGG